MKYAGIGSRETPTEILKVMRDYAYALSCDTLRSGGAPGADMAFETGAIAGDGTYEIYLPWKGFNGHDQGFLNEPTKEAVDIAAQYHPGWKYLKRPVRLLMGRNTHQILGRDLDDPVDFVLCWTPDGSLDGASRKAGGTGQALRIAHDRGIEVINLQRAAHLDEILRRFLLA